MEPVGTCSPKIGDFWRQMRGVPQTSITKYTTAKQGWLSSQICISNVFTRCATLIFNARLCLSRRGSAARRYVISQEIHVPARCRDGNCINTRCAIWISIGY
jgi:hypothetical protein